jgi:hypothetical protein
LEYKNEENRKILNLDTKSGSEACASFLSCIERLMINAFNQKLGSKKYRSNFSSSYQQLFRRNQECSYLSDIFDSA